MLVEDFLCDTDHSSLQRYRTVYKADHSDCQCSDYLSSVRCYPHRRLISEFRCGCHGLHIDIGRFGKDSEHCSREDRPGVAAERTTLGSALCACLAQ